MIDREDIVFATCYQLAQLISTDWENQPVEVAEAIEALEPFDEPGEPYYGAPPILNPLGLTASETEPESMRLDRRYEECKAIAHVMKTIMKHSDGWLTPDSDTLKKEIISRITTYEREAERIIAPVPEACSVFI